jgi:Family of unknown function (DUF5522)
MHTLQKETDYYFNEQGFMVFTASYLLKQNKCCGNKCLHCPYNHINVVSKNNSLHPNSETKLIKS